MESSSVHPTTIVPSILAADFSRLGEECVRVLRAGASWLHVDVMDGCFVPNITLGVPVLQCLHRALPEARYDVHLMLQQPHRYIQAFAEAGATLITFHVEADSPILPTIEAIHAAGCQAGLVLSPATPVETVRPYLAQLELVLAMTVEPGFGGQAFMTEQLDKVRTLRAWREQDGLGYHIEVDGGVRQNNIAACRAAGADMLVAGSAVFRSADAAAALAALREAAG